MIAHINHKLMIYEQTSKVLKFHTKSEVKYATSAFMMAKGNKVLVFLIGHELYIATKATASGCCLLPAACFDSEKSKCGVPIYRLKFTCDFLLSPHL